MAILTVSCVSAADNDTQQMDVLQVDEDAIPASDVPQAEDNIPEEENTVIKNASFTADSTTNYLSDSNFTVNLKDDSGSAVVNKTVSFTIGGKIINSTTDDEGNAKLLLNVSKGTYTVKYTFNETGFNPISSTSKILVMTTGVSKIKASTYKAYKGFTNIYRVTLTVDGMPLAGRYVTFKVVGKTFKKKTDSKGVASLSVSSLTVGTHAITFSYAGEKNIQKSSGSSKIYMIKGMPKIISRANNVVYKNKISTPFKIKLVSARGIALKNKKITFTIKGKKYVKYTNKDGIATLYIKRTTGTYTIKVYTAKTTYYKADTKYYSIKVQSNNARNNGFWLFGSDMKKVNLDSLKKVGTKHIFLNAKAVELWGQSGVEKFISSASGKGIKVHIWMQVFYDGKWINPVKNGKIDYDLIKSKVNLAKKYAKIKGVAGVHFDYLRYPGNAYKYSAGVSAVNYFVKTATSAVHAINSKLIVSAAVMPEPSSMKYYYGQDIPTISKYLDVIIPMIYKGNYNAGSSWIQKVTAAFVKQSSHAKIWSGIQTYKSDSDVTKLSATSLMKDADAAAAGGAYGVILFRWGITNLINFNKI